MATFDLYQTITDQIIRSIEAGTPAWRKPWTGEAGGSPFPRRANGEHYRGINVLMLWLAAEENGYRSAYWFTYRQAQEAGGQVRKGERSSTGVKYGTLWIATEVFLKWPQIFLCGSKADVVWKRYRRYPALQKIS